MTSRVLQSFGLATVANLAGPVSMIVIAPILAHALGPSDRGDVAAATAGFLLLAAALTLGLPEAITYVLGRSMMSPRDALFRAVPMLFLLGGAGAAAMFVLAPQLAGDNPQVELVIRWTALALVPTQIMWAYRGVAQGLGQWNQIAFERLLGSAARVVAVVVLLIFDYLTVTSAAVAILLGPLMGLVVYLVPRNQPRSMCSAPNRTKRLISFGMTVWLGSIAGVLVARVDQVLMVGLSDRRELGFYAVAANVGEVFLFATSAVGAVMMSREASSPNMQAVGRASRTLLICTFAATVPLAATTWVWVPFVFGSDFVAASLPASMLLIAGAAGAVGSVAGATLTARGFPRDRSVALAGGALCNVLLVIVLTPPLGATGTAVATLATSAMMSVWALTQLQRRTGTSWTVLAVPRKADVAFLANLLRGRTT